MAEDIKAGELYLEVKANIDNLKKDLEKLKTYISAKANESEKLLRFQAKFDNALAKLRISELKNLHSRLKSELEKKIRLDVNSRSIELTQAKLQAVERRLKSINEQSNNVGGGFKLGGFGLGGISAAIGGFTALIGVMKSAISNAQDAIIAQRQIEQAVKQTGMAAGFTAEQIQKMAGELQKLTGIDDDIILTDVSNQLLTFTNISGDAFRRAQQAVLDLNAVIARGEISGLSSQAIQLGKALEDPIRGVTALTRVGVTFTEQQKAQIREYIRLNDLASAQKIILDEIEAKYGGQAKALNEATGGIKNFNASLGDLLEKLGKPLLSVLQTVANEIYKVIDAFESFGDDLEDLKLKVSDYDTKVASLISRYDILKNKTNLNKEEQNELLSIIQQLGDVVPLAVTKWDAYGRATEINTAKIKDFIDAERERLKLLEESNKKEIESEINKLKRQKELLESQRERLSGTGKKQITFTRLEGITIEADVNSSDINNLNNQINNLQKQIDEYTNKLKSLKGEVDKSTDIKTPKVSPYIEEILNKYDEQLAKLNDINKALKNNELTEEQVNALKKERQSLIDSLYGKEIELSKLPSKYTSEQIAQFERLKFAVDGYVDYRKELIELSYENEVSKAKGNADLIKQAEVNKILALEKLKEEETAYKEQLNRKQIEDFENTVGEIERINQKHKDELLKQEIKHNQQKQKALQDYYNQVGALDDTYWAYKIDQIRQQAEEFASLTGDAVKAKELEIAQLQELEQAYFEWRLEQLRTNYGLSSVLFSATLDSMQAGYQTFWDVLAREDLSGAEKRKAIWETIKTTALQTIGEMVAEYIKKMVVMAVAGDAIKTAELTKGIALGSALYAAYAPAALAASIMTFGSASLAGLGAYQSALAFLELQKASGAIPKFASGGDFVVPPNYPNDSFPILVESGERVRVTPRGQATNESKLLTEVIDSIRALTKTLYEKPMVVNVDSNIDSFNFTVKEVMPSITKVIKTGIKVE